jgi:hypothetical protein
MRNWFNLESRVLTSAKWASDSVLGMRTPREPGIPRKGAGCKKAALGVDWFLLRPACLQASKPIINHN